MKTVKQLEKEVSKVIKEVESAKKRFESEQKEFKKAMAIVAKQPNKTMTDAEIKKKFPYLHKLSKTQ